MDLLGNCWGHGGFWGQKNAILRLRPPRNWPNTTFRSGKALIGAWWQRKIKDILSTSNSENKPEISW